MIGPTVDRSTGDGELVGDALLGDAAAVTTGPLLDGATLDSNELGTWLAEGIDAAGDEATGGLLVTEAAWCDPEHAVSKRHAVTPAADRLSTRRRVL
ncbi:MAG TPA: hypothetical protein VIJ96_01465 [Acidothermaceae bacterium]